MNIARGFGEARRDDRDGGRDGGRDGARDDVEQLPCAIGGDERRMHVRAYNHWVSMLNGRAYPSIEDLDPSGIADFGAQSVLLDFTGGLDDPTFPYLGTALRAECGIDQSITRVADVPARSLLSRLTDHYLQIIANRAPIGFEAEFTGTRGYTTMYRGILMPFSSNGEAIDYIYGVINWKEVADAATQVALTAELADAMRSVPASVGAPPPIWADGPGSEGLEPAPDGLADHLALARESAATLAAADGRSRAALYETLARAHDFQLAARADPAAFVELLEDAGIKAQARAPMTPVVKLVFGGGYDKTRLTEFAAVLSHAARAAVGTGMLAGYLAAHPGGIKGLVAAERAARRTARTPAPEAAPVSPVAFAQRAVIGSLVLDTGVAAGEIVVLVGRTDAGGRVDILASVADARIVAAASRTLR